MVTTFTPSLGRRIAAIAVPALGTLAAEPLYQLSDSAIIGRLGPSALASLGLAYAVLTFPFWITAFIQRAVTTQSARASAGDLTERSAASAALADGLAVAVVLGTGLAAVLWLLARPLAFALNGRGTVLAGAVDYLHIGVLGMPLLLVSFVGHGLLQGSGRTRRSLLVVIVANAVNIVLELWFVRVRHWGLAGSAWGTLIAQAITAAWLLAIVLRERRSHTTGAVGPDWLRMRRMVWDGLRFGVRTACIAGTFIVATAAATRMGPVPAAAHQIVSQLFYLSALALDALALAGQVLIAEHLGSAASRTARNPTGEPHLDSPEHGSPALTGRTKSIEREPAAAGSGAIVRHLSSITLWFGIAVAVVFAATAGVLPRLFTHDGPVRSAAVPAALILGLMSVPGAIAFLYDGVFVGTGDISHMVRSALTATTCFIPFGIISLVWPRTGLTLLWAGLCTWMLARALLHLRKARTSGWI
jgi:putative MATE family efflux protein